jgi:hypothetical protein
MERTGLLAPALVACHILAGRGKRRGSSASSAFSYQQIGDTVCVQCGEAELSTPFFHHELRDVSKTPNALSERNFTSDFLMKIASSIVSTLSLGDDVTTLVLGPTGGGKTRLSLGASFGVPSSVVGGGSVALLPLVLQRLFQRGDLISVSVAEIRPSPSQSSSLEAHELTSTPSDGDSLLYDLLSGTYHRIDNEAEDGSPPPEVLDGCQFVTCRSLESALRCICDGLQRSVSWTSQAPSASDVATATFLDQAIDSTEKAAPPPIPKEFTLFKRSGRSHLLVQVKFPHGEASQEGDPAYLKQATRWLLIDPAGPELGNFAATPSAAMGQRTFRSVATAFAEKSTVPTGLVGLLKRCFAVSWPVMLLCLRDETGDYEPLNETCIATGRRFQEAYQRPRAYRSKLHRITLSPTTFVDEGDSVRASRPLLPSMMAPRVRSKDSVLDDILQQQLRLQDKLERLHQSREGATSQGPTLPDEAIQSLVADTEETGNEPVPQRHRRGSRLSPSKLATTDLKPDQEMQNPSAATDFLLLPSQAQRPDFNSQHHSSAALLDTPNASYLDDVQERNQGHQSQSQSRSRQGSGQLDTVLSRFELQERAKPWQATLRSNSEEGGSTSKHQKPILHFENQGNQTIAIKDDVAGTAHQAPGYRASAHRAVPVDPDSLNTSRVTSIANERTADSELLSDLPGSHLEQVTNDDQRKLQAAWLGARRSTTELEEKPQTFAERSALEELQHKYEALEMERKTTEQTLLSAIPPLVDHFEQENGGIRGEVAKQREQDRRLIEILTQNNAVLNPVATELSWADGGAAAKDRRIRFLERELVASHESCALLRNQLVEERRHSHHSEAFRSILNKSGSLFTDLQKKVKLLQQKVHRAKEDEFQTLQHNLSLKRQLAVQDDRIKSLEHLVSQLQGQNQLLSQTQRTKMAQRKVAAALTRGALGRSDGRPTADIVVAAPDELPDVEVDSAATTNMGLGAVLEGSLKALLDAAHGPLASVEEFFADDMECEGLSDRTRRRLRQHLHQSHQKLAKSASNLRHDLRSVQRELREAAQREQQYLHTVTAAPTR